MDHILNKDVEKQPAGGNSLLEDEAGAVPASSFEFGNSTYAKLQRLGAKFKVELRGIERVPEDERTDSSYWNIGSMVLPSHSSHFPMTFVLIISI